MLTLVGANPRTSHTLLVLLVAPLLEMLSEPPSPFVLVVVTLCTWHVAWPLDLWGRLSRCLA